MSDWTVNKSKVRQAFASAANHYDGFARLQRQVGRELLRRFPVEHMNGLLLDVGAGTGFLTAELAQTHEQPILAMDIAMPMLQASRAKYPDLNVQYLCADAEKLPLASLSIQQIYSNLALQWMQDLSATMQDFKRILRADGRLVFATFGPQTLRELKTAWAAVDDDVHVNTFQSVEQIHTYLQYAGFIDIDIQSMLYAVSYPDVQALMLELKGIGAHHVHQRRKQTLTTRTQLQNMIQQYQRQMSDQRIMASYEILFVQAKTL